MQETQETLRLNEDVDAAAGQCSLHLAGWLDSSNSFLLEQWLDANLGKGYKRIAFCCEDLQFASSAGIRVFLDAARRVKQADDCELVFSRVRENLQRVFIMTGMNKIITLAD